jgi:hypothetical protein
VSEQWPVASSNAQSTFHSRIFDFLSLMLQKGHIGWYSVKFVLHRGQYQAIDSHA